MKRRILFVSGTRADFGLLESTLAKIAKHSSLDISVCITGTHLLQEFGNTQTDIEKTGLRVCGRIHLPSGQDDGATMAKGIGKILIEVTNVIQSERPDILLVLGDRGEMLAAALAASHLGVPVVHVHGGERSGTIDESIRHAISKIAHYHFVATQESRTRLIRMGELPETIFVTGAPGLDGISELVKWDRLALAQEVNFDPTQPIALVTYHPVVQDAHLAGVHALEMINALNQYQLQAIVTLPNSDAGNRAIRQLFLDAESRYFRTFPHLARDKYVSWMAAADVMLGNSSSGIIEAASFGLPVVNIGDRQRLRERSANVVDCDPVCSKISNAIKEALTMRRSRFENVYGDGCAGDRIVEKLASIPLHLSIMKKSNAY